MSPEASSTPDPSVLAALVDKGTNDVVGIDEAARGQSRVRVNVEIEVDERASRQPELHIYERTAEV